jgi:hypothetical protein
MLGDIESILLPNRQAVNLNATTSFIFETDKLDNADPVFITRNGIINIRDDFIQPKRLFYHYLQTKMPKLVSSNLQFIVAKFDYLYLIMTTIISEFGGCEVYTCTNYVRNIMHVFQSFIDEFY